MNEMENKVVIITGASSGIGKASVEKFASEGAKVVLVARRKSKLLELAKEIDNNSDKTLIIAADITREQEIEEIVKKTVDKFGEIDVLVNAAGIIASGTISTTKLDDWDYMMNINVRAPFYLIQCVLPYLKRSKGSIVNVSSVTGIRSFPGILAYCTSKAGMDQMTHCIALEVASDGVRVNAVDPGVVVTMLHRTSGVDDDAYAKFLEHSKTTHPLGRVGQPEEVAELIYFLASPKSGWITGVSVPIDGGRSQTCAR